MFFITLAKTIVYIMINTNERLAIDKTIYFFKSAEFHVQFIRGIFMDTVDERGLNHIEFLLSKYIKESNGNEAIGLLRLATHLTHENKEVLYEYILSDDKNKESVIQNKVLGSNL